MTSTRASLLLAASLACSGPVVAEPCNRTCLEGFVDRYLDAVVAHDPAQAPLARAVRFTENGQRLRPGDGLANTASARGPSRMHPGVRARRPQSDPFADLPRLVEKAMADWQVPGLRDDRRLALKIPGEPEQELVPVTRTMCKVKGASTRESSSRSARTGRCAARRSTGERARSTPSSGSS